MATGCLKHTLIVLFFLFTFPPPYIRLRVPLTDFICIADTVTVTDLNLLNTLKEEFVLLRAEEPRGPRTCGAECFL